MATHPEATYRLDPATSSFVVDNYNWAPAFSNFLPGIAGKWGIPLWLYYVSRGQAVSSFGVRDKNGQILEFYSFNKAVMRVAREGFRTFVRLDDRETYEPFQKTSDPRVHQQLVVSASELVLHETNAAHGLAFDVAYFPLPNMRVAGLVRELTIRNTSSAPRRVECIDGLPRILPFGLDQARIKGIPRHIEGMMGVGDCDGAAVYRLKQTADDSEQVAQLHEAHFYVSVGARLGAGLIVDPDAVFGEPMSYDRPWTFETGGIDAVLAAPQYRDNKTPSALTARAATLAPGESMSILSVIGYAHSDADLLAAKPLLLQPELLAGKRRENTHVIDEIGQHAFTASASPAFDAYARQTFLDNVVRGGMPVMFETNRERVAFYMYSRQNGDLERDYHFFVLEPTYLSQGTGHYRSVLQNRRTDVWFFPETEDANLITFLDLVQLDGYNPLEVGISRFQVVDRARAERELAEHVTDPAARDELLTYIERAFTPGELVMRLESAGRRPEAGWQAVLAEVIGSSRALEVGGLHEGFWADHWHYNIDLIDTYLMVYPDRLGALLVGRRDYTYFDDPDVVQPRTERAVDAGGKIRMYGAVVRDRDKLARVAARSQAPYTVRTRGGDGDIYHTTLLVKLLTIVTNRLATLDANGVGIEMEAGKPGWNDSMNGLPGLFGSGLSETLELARTVQWLRTALAHPQLSDTREVAIYDELVVFMRGLRGAMHARLHGDVRDGAQTYWRAANDLKEAYRAATKRGVSGAETMIARSELSDLLELAGAMLGGVFDGPGRGLAVSPHGVPYTYFVNDVVESRPTGKRGHGQLPTVEPLAFRQRPVKLFLEGPVHWMKVRREEARQIYDAVRESPIFDSALKMYKACESMVGESYELGRAIGAYPRGWIENESIYLHMEYKYLLEILRSGLCDEFWRDARTALIPFMDPAVYGRSTLEGASFIVSSAYEDPRLHGRGFQPRLSGITCEMLHIWILAVAGEHPFRLASDGTLELALEPRLPEWLFTTEPSTHRFHDRVDGWQDLALPVGAFAFKLMDRALVVYDNAARAATFGSDAIYPVAHRLHYRDGRSVEIAGRTIPGSDALAVREGRVRRIDVTLGR
jgi:hypothetical protein